MLRRGAYLVAGGLLCLASIVTPLRAEDGERERLWGTLTAEGTDIGADAPVRAVTTVVAATPLPTHRSCAEPEPSPSPNRGGLYQPPKADPWGPVCGRVIDRDTEKPIAGAVIIVRRILPVSDLHRIYETDAAVSADDGWFEVPRRALPEVTPQYQPRADLACVAPGYGVREQGKGNAEVTFDLQALASMEQQECFNAQYPHFIYLDPPSLPAERRAELAAMVNATRQGMGLQPIDLSSGQPMSLNGRVPCPEDKPENRWGPYEGTVVDRDTGEPIPGAACVVGWGKYKFNPIEEVKEFFDARVSVTDRRGRFTIPRRDPPFFSAPISGPWFVCIAPGYTWEERAPVREGIFYVRLRSLDRLRGNEARRYRWSPGPTEFDMIPKDKVTELQLTVNRRREQMGLPHLNLRTGKLER